MVILESISVAAARRWARGAVAPSKNYEGVTTPTIHQTGVHAYAHNDCVTIGGKIVRSYDFSVQSCRDPRMCDSLGPVHVYACGMLDHAGGVLIQTQFVLVHCTRVVVVEILF